MPSPLNRKGEKPREVVFVDGNTGQVVKTVPFGLVPASNREVRVPGKAEPVPVAKVVKVALDEDGEPVAQAEAVQVIVREYDEAGGLLRESFLTREEETGG